LVAAWAGAGRVAPGILAALAAGDDVVDGEIFFVEDMTAAPFAGLDATVNTL
jgi:hypothetical protein